MKPPSFEETETFLAMNERMEQLLQENTALKKTVANVAFGGRWMNRRGVRG